MKKITDLGEKAKALAGGLQPSHRPKQYELLCSIIDELTGIATALPLVHSHDDVPPDNGEGFSDDVLIDLNGFRKEFAVGWYDHDAKEWRFHEEDRPRSYFAKTHMKWSYLHLEKYDK